MRRLVDLAGPARSAVNTVLPNDDPSLLTYEEPSLNGNRRTSFGDMTLAGSLITGSNEGTLKA